MTERTEREYQEILDAIEEFFDWAGQENDVDHANLEIPTKARIFGTDKSINL